MEKYDNTLEIYNTLSDTLQSIISSYLKESVS